MALSKNNIDNSNRSIIFVTISMTGGGTERVISVLANYWASHATDVTIVMIAGNEVAYDLNKNILVKNVSGATGGDTRGRIERIRRMREVFRANPDATVIAMGSVASMFTAVALLGLKNRLIVSERNDPGRLNYRPIKSYEKVLRNLLYHRASNVVFQTDMAMELFSGAIRKRGIIIMNPVDENLPKPTGYEQRGKYIISAGRINKKKNLRLLVDAFSEFYKDHKDYKLLIYGEGEESKNIGQHICELGLNEAIIMKGFSHDLCGEMNQARIFVSSSDSEGISNSIVEAMAMGMVVIATDCPVGGSRMLIDSGNNGILFGVGDKNELVEALKRVMDINVAKRYSDKAIEVRTKYSVSEIIGNWERLI